MSALNTNAEPIAIVGLTALYPGSVHRQAFWRNIVAGRDFITDIPPDHFLIEDYFDPDPRAPGKIYVKRGAFLPAVPFNPLEFGLPPKNLASTDSVQLLALLGAKQLLGETRSFASGAAARARTSVILGVAAGTELIGQMAAKIQAPQWRDALRREGVPETQVERICARIASNYPDWNESTFPGLLANVVAGRIANRFDLGGANCVIDAACASSLGAITLAVDELRLGKADLVVSGGADALNDVFMFMCFTRTPAMSMTGDCRPFSDAADGTMLGEGVGLFALRRLADAERDGDAIYAVIRGIGASSDGTSKSVYAPRAEGQALAIERALAEAGCRADDIELIEAHGTATKAGDVAEFEGLKQAFTSAQRTDHGWCALGSVKSQIGHTKSAAGAAGLFKAVLALRQGVLPPTVKIDRPNPALAIESSAFYLNTMARPWIRDPASPRRAGLSSFGFGGSNYHLTLEEYRGSSVAPRVAHDSSALILVSADTRDTLLARLQALNDEPVATPLATLALTSWKSFSASHAHRAAIVANDRASFAKHAASLHEKLTSSQDANLRIPGVAHYRATKVAGDVAFLFPGQGSQYIYMSAGLTMEFEAARRVWDRLATSDEFPLHRHVFPPPVFDDAQRRQQEAALVRTEIAQPAIGVAALAHLTLLDTLGVKAACVAGHSYGELVALHAAGAIADPERLIALSAARGRLMADAAMNTTGAMTAVFAAASDVEPLLSDGLVIANYNGPRQVVVSGSTSAIESFEARAKERGFKARRLAVSTAFHSPLVAAAADRFTALLARESIASARIAVFANTTATPYPSDANATRTLLGAQLAQPVRFSQTLDAMHAAGARIFIEVGPGNVLTSLVGQTLADRPHLAVALDGGRNGNGVAAFLDALAQLTVAGVALDLAALYAGFEAEMPDPALLPQPKGSVMINGTNLGKPYPPPNGASGRAPPNPDVPAYTHTTPTTHVAAMTDSAPPSHDQPTDQSCNDQYRRLALLEQIQRNMLEAQRHFQDTLAQSHLAFLQTSEALLRQIGGQPSSPPTVSALSVSPPAPMPMRAPAPMAAPSQPIVMRPPPTGSPVVRDVARVAPATASIIAPIAAPAPTVPARATNGDHRTLILATIAEHTGYPIEMIGLDMELEAGLGIDSIKKVEIFSALQTKIPQFGDVDTGLLGELRTPGAILTLTEKLAHGGAIAKK
jgi:polyketide-type polyunsaturated fatty acid synthase PfaA